MASIYNTSKREWYTRFALGISGLIIATPGIIGVLSLQMIAEMYKTGPISDLEAVLLQHRAILLAVIGGMLLAAIVWKPLRLPAIIAALISNLGYVMFVLAYPSTNDALGIIASIDVVLSIMLFIILITREPSRKIANSSSIHAAHQPLG